MTKDEKGVVKDIKLVENYELKKWESFCE